MKEERFEKVVEWKKHPDKESMAFGIFLGSIALALIIPGLVNPICYFKNPLCNFATLRAMFIIGGILTFFFLLSITIIVNSLGKEKKVYWRKIR